MQYNSPCWNCKHYNTNFTCKAFDAKIPDKYFNGEEKHDKVVEGQMGDYVYSPIILGKKAVELKKRSK